MEKPATINFSEAIEIKDYLKKANIFFSEAFMYRYHPQIQSVIKIIKDNRIGNLLSMKTSFGINILTKKKLFIFNKKKKINPKSRLFDKDLGGGCILDLGCYPSSFSLLIGSLKNKLSSDSFEISNISTEKGETGVDINSSAEILFQDGFKSKVNASFKDDLGKKSIIYGEKGTIFLNNSWLGGDIVVRSKDKPEQKLHFETDKNIYGYQIEEISKNLIQGLNKVNFHIMSLDETLLNMKIIDDWLNYG